MAFTIVIVEISLFYVNILFNIRYSTKHIRVYVNNAIQNYWIFPWSNWQTCNKWIHRKGAAETNKKKKRTTFDLARNKKGELFGYKKSSSKHEKLNQWRQGSKQTDSQFWGRIFSSLLFPSTFGWLASWPPLGSWSTWRPGSVRPGGPRRSWCQWGSSSWRGHRLRPPWPLWAHSRGLEGKGSDELPKKNNWQEIKTFLETSHPTYCLPYLTLYLERITIVPAGERKNTSQLRRVIMLTRYERHFSCFDGRCHSIFYAIPYSTENCKQRALKKTFSLSFVHNEATRHHTHVLYESEKEREKERDIIFLFLPEAVLYSGLLTACLNSDHFHFCLYLIWKSFQRFQDFREFRPLEKYI